MLAFGTLVWLLAAADIARADFRQCEHFGKIAAAHISNDGFRDAYDVEVKCLLGASTMMIIWVQPNDMSTEQKDCR